MALVCAVAFNRDSVYARGTHPSNFFSLGNVRKSKERLSFYDLIDGVVDDKATSPPSAFWGRIFVANGIDGATCDSFLHLRYP